MWIGITISILAIVILSFYIGRGYEIYTMNKEERKNIAQNVSTPQ